MKLVENVKPMMRRDRSSDYELAELREHVENISFNISKVYRHVEKHSRKKVRKEVDYDRSNLKKKFSSKDRAKIKGVHFY